MALKLKCTAWVKKELVDGGMEKEVWSINDQDLKRAIKLMKVNKATDESGMIAEYIKALGEQDVKNLSVLMNDVLSGESIPKEWKQARAGFQAGFLYADDVCLIASNEQDLQKIFDSISGCISEYSMKVSEKKYRK